MTALVLKATIVLAAAWCCATLLRSRSAALRHVIWTAALAAILLLPLFGTLTTSWTPVIAEIPALNSATVVVTAAAETVPAEPIRWLPILYATGVLLAAFRFVAGGLRVSWIFRQGTPHPLGTEYGVRVVTSPAAPVPMAWGIFRRIVLLPAAAIEWPAERLRAVLLHESMHHRRLDLLTQAIAQAACCAYWFHPLAWLALARQRRERERACDDAVLLHGLAPHDYASALVEIVRAMTPTRRPVDAPAMADAGSLESRVRAVLDRAIDRRPVTRRSAVAVALAAALLLAPLTVVHLRAQAGGATITGTVEDPSGARIPNCRVTAKNLDGANQETARADAAGEYRIANIPPGRYALEFSTPGFALGKMETVVVAGATARLDARLVVGQISETVKVMGSRTSPAPAPQTARAPVRIRVGGNVTPSRIVRQPRPVYPAELQQAGVEGIVRLRAIVGKDGALLQPRVINSVDPRLAQAALDAVAQWRYQPALLNGEPIETVTEIEMAFELGQ
jgi:TonB family protein